MIAQVAILDVDLVFGACAIFSQHAASRMRTDTFKFPRISVKDGNEVIRAHEIRAGCHFERWS